MSTRRLKIGPIEMVFRVRQVVVVKDETEAQNRARMEAKLPEVRRKMLYLLGRICFLRDGVFGAGLYQAVAYSLVDLGDYMLQADRPIDALVHDSPWHKLEKDDADEQ